MRELVALVIVMNAVYLLLGTNIGDRLTNLNFAVDYIKDEIGLISKVSSIYETEPWGEKNQNWFLNQALKAQSFLNPYEVLDKIHLIENKMGRKKNKKWGERIIDIDILYFNNMRINEKNLVIPHPFLHERKFCLVPLAEIAGSMIHPILKKNTKEILYLNKEELRIKLYSEKLVSSKQENNY